MLGFKPTVLLFFLITTCIVNGARVGVNNHKPVTVAAAWYAGWHADTGYPLSKVSWSKYTHMTYAFAETTPNVEVLEVSNPSVLPQFISEAQKHGVKALVSVGGWTGSRGFSTAVATAHNRTAFVKTITEFATKYKVDGIDFDWEYPASQGIGCNSNNPQDTANFLSFLQELRQNPLGSRLILTAAAATNPFVGPTGTSLADVSGFAKVLDYIAIMNYDLWGPWSPTVGPNAPLDDSCAAPEHQGGSAVAAVHKWNKAGIPLEQLVLGVPAYGHSFRVRKANAFAKGSTTTLASYPSFDSSAPPTGDSWDDAAGLDVCGTEQGPGGNINFWGMIGLGYLNADGTPKEGRPFRFDTCSQTAYSYDPTTEIMVSYDNAQSFAAKGKYIREKGMGGFATWEAGGDHNDILLNSIRKGAMY